MDTLRIDDYLFTLLVVIRLLSSSSFGSWFFIFKEKLARQLCLASLINCVMHQRHIVENVDNH